MLGVEMMMTIKVTTLRGGRERILDTFTSNDASQIKNFFISTFDSLEVSIANGERQGAKIIVEI